MRHRPFVLLTALVFAMVACSSSSDDAATTATDTQTTDTPEATTPATQPTATVPEPTMSPVPVGGLILDPPSVPAVVGAVEIEVTGDTTDIGGAAVFSCPGAGTERLNTEANLTELCANVPERFASYGEMFDLGANIEVPDGGPFVVSLVVFVDQEMIDDGGVLIVQGDTVVPIDRTAVLEIAGTGTPAPFWGPLPMTLDPPSVPAVVGPIEIQVHASGVGSDTAVAVFACPALGGLQRRPAPTPDEPNNRTHFDSSTCGNVPERFDSANQMREMGALRNPGQAGEDPTEDSAFTTTLTVYIDQQMIDDGAVVIMVADMFISPFGTAVLAIGTPAEAFSFADDDLCEWVTEEEIAAFVAAAFDWNGTVTQTPPDAPATCEWRLTANAGERLTIAYDAEQWQAWEGGAFEFAALDIVDFSDEDPRAIEGAAVSGHPALSDGVLVTADGWAQFAFWVPPRHQYLALMISVPGEELSYPIDDRVFMVADQFLRELGWAD